MTQRFDENVSVSLIYDSNKKKVYPNLVSWKGKIHKIIKIGLHHKYLKGNTLYHIFSVTTGTLFMRLKFNTKSLTWVLEEFEERNY